MNKDMIVNAALAAANGNNGWPTPAHVWQVDEHAALQLSDGNGHLLDGATISWWI